MQELQSQISEMRNEIDSLKSIVNRQAEKKIDDTNESPAVNNNTPIYQMCVGCKLPKPIYAKECCKYCCTKLFQKKSKVSSHPKELFKRSMPATQNDRNCQICFSIIKRESIVFMKKDYCETCYEDRGKAERLCVDCKEIRPYHSFGRCCVCSKKFKANNPHLIKER